MSQSAFGMLFGLLLSLVTPFLTQATVDDGIGMRNMERNEENDTQIWRVRNTYPDVFRFVGYTQ